MTGPLIAVSNLSKSYGDTPALAGLDWTVEPGSVAGVLGPNGAGKTTLAKILLGITRPTSGSVSILGHDVRTHPEHARQAVGFLPEERVPYGDMRPGTFLKFYGRFFDSFDGGVARRFLDGWEVPMEARIRDLSKGNRAKVGLAAVLARRPLLLMLDEPTVDLDPASSEEVLSLVASWVADGERSVVLVTHRLESVERVCDNVLFLNQGKALAQGDLDDLRGRWKRLTASGPFPSPTELKTWDGVRSVRSAESWVDLMVEDGSEALAQRLRSAGATDVQVHGVSLRDIYLTLMDYQRGRLDGVLESLV